MAEALRTFKNFNPVCQRCLYVHLSDDKPAKALEFYREKPKGIQPRKSATG